MTLVFSDMTGSTSMGEKLDPESIRRVLTMYFDEMKRVLEHHGGTIEKFIGDAVVAVFGIPKIHEDDALRAVRATAEMQQAIARLGEQTMADWGVALQFRTGVNTGEVVAGELSREQGFATGDAVNVAARLEQHAPPGEMLIGESTYQLVRDAVEAELIEPLSLKGKAEPVRAWKLGKVVRETGVARRLDSPLVGREGELARLHAELDDAIDDRSCRVATVLGEAGVGKSRLTNEFSISAIDRARILRGRCLSYGKGMTFWPVAEAVKQAAAIVDTDSPEQAVSKIEGLLPPGSEESGMIAERVAGLSGLGQPSGGGIQQSFWALRRLFEALAQSRPLVLVFDDLHWAEPTFVDFLDYLIHFTKDSPIFVLCMARPEFLDAGAPWMTPHAKATTIRIMPLEEDLSQRLIENLLGDVSLSRDVMDRILESAEGNPLFVEEMLRMMVDSGLLARDGGRWVPTGDISNLSLPPTINALLAARLDHLAPGEREALQCGSVVGQVFWWDSVSAMSSGDNKVANLQMLVRKELIQPEQESLSGEDAFRFSHILIRDAAYLGIPKAARAELHERFASWLESKGGERSEEYEEIVGYHLEQAYRYRRELGPLDQVTGMLGIEAGERLHSAGARAMNRSDTLAAIDLLNRAIEVLGSSHPLRIRSLFDLGSALSDRGELTRAEAVFDEVIREAFAEGNRALALKASLERESLLLHTDPEGRGKRIMEIANDALPLLEKANDDSGLALVWFRIGWAKTVWCRYGEATEALDRALAHAERTGDVRQQGRILLRLAGSLDAGPIPASDVLKRFEELLERVKGDRVCESAVLGEVAQMKALGGCFEEARQLCRQVGAIYHEFGMQMAAAQNRADEARIEMLSGDTLAAERHLRASLDGLTALEEKSHLSTRAAELAEVLYLQGRYGEAEHFTRVSEETGSGDDVETQAKWRAVRALVFAREGKVAEARELGQEAASRAETTDFLYLLGDVYSYVGEAALICKDVPAAVSAYKKSLLFHEQKGNVPSADRVRNLLEKIFI